MYKFLENITANNTMKKLIVLINDFSILAISINIALVVRYEEFLFLNTNHMYYFLGSSIILLLLFLSFNTLNSVTRYFGQKTFSNFGIFSSSIFSILFSTRYESF